MHNVTKLKAAIIKPAEFITGKKALPAEPDKMGVVEPDPLTPEKIIPMVEPLLMSTVKDGSGGVVLPYTEIAVALGMRVPELMAMVQDSPELKEAIEHWAAVVNMLIQKDVRKSLYQISTGQFSHKETKVFCTNGQIVECDIDKFYAPSEKAIDILLTDISPEYRAAKRNIDKQPLLQMPISVSFGVADCSIEGQEERILEEMRRYE